MGILVCNGAQLTCSFGLSPSVLSITSAKVLSGTPSATVMDMIPMTNIMPFGMCRCSANPAVAQATAAAFGVPTPAPCMPVITSQWAPGSPTVLIASKPALSSTSQLSCAYGGIIQIVSPGQTKTQVK